MIVNIESSGSSVSSVVDDGDWVVFGVFLTTNFIKTCTREMQIVLKL